MKDSRWDLLPIQQIPILDVASRLGIQVRGTKAMCFSGHDKRTPSLTFSRMKNTWRCYGACGKGGDGIALAMAQLQCDFKSALGWFAREFGIDVRPQQHRGRSGTYSYSVKKQSHMASGTSTQTAKQCEFSPNPALYTWFIGKCGVVSRVQGLKYLSSHGIPLDVANRFGVRELRDPERALRKATEQWDSERVFRSGLAWGDAGVPERLIWTSYALLFPFQAGGSVQYIQGRIFRGNQKYLNPRGIPKPLYNVDSVLDLPAGALVHVCEGVPDVLALESKGFHAIGVLGASSFRPEWVDLLMRYDVVLMPDGDQGGDTFRRTISALFLAHGKAVRTVHLPLGKDVADVIANMKGSP